MQGLVGTIGENMRFKRCAYLTVEKGIIATYTHGRVLAEVSLAEVSLAEVSLVEGGEGEESSVEVSMGALGVALALESNSTSAELEETGKALAMHIASAKPIVVSRADLPAATVRQEEEILLAQAQSTSAKGAPIDKIVRGRLEKFFRSVVLDEQRYALDETRSIASMLADAGGSAGAAVRVTGFLRIALGEQA